MSKDANEKGYLENRDLRKDGVTLKQRNAA